MSFSYNLIIICSLCINFTLSTFVFDKIVCEGFDDKLVTVKKCYCRPVKRNVKIIDVNVYIHEKVADNVTFRYVVMKRANGWKPFLFDIKVDLCSFLRRQNNPFLKVVVNFLRTKYTVRRLECPFEGALVFENITSTEVTPMADALPFPTGHYRHTMSFTYMNVPRGTIQLFLNNE